MQILVLVARSLTEILTEDDRSGERFRVAARCDVGQSVLSHCAETALNRLHCVLSRTPYNQVAEKYPGRGVKSA